MSFRQSVLLSPQNITQAETFNKWNLYKYGQQLQASISYHTLLLEPVIFIATEKHPELILGHGLVNSIRDQQKQIQCTLLPSTTTSVEILQLIYSYFEKHITESPIIEAQFLSLCLSHFDEPFIIKSLSSIFAGNLNRKSIQRSHKLLSFEPSVQKLIHEKTLSEKICDKLAELSSAELDAVVNTIVYLNIGGNKQKKLLDICNELSKRQSISIVDLFNQEQLSRVLSTEEMNKPQVTQQLFQILHEMAFPKSNQAIEEFNQKKTQLNLPESCDIQPAKAFERDEVTLTVTFKSLQDFEYKWKEIKRVFKPS